MKTGRKPVDVVANAPTRYGRDAIWPVVRELKRFTVSDIAKRTVVADKTVRGYLTALEASGRLSSKKPSPTEGRVFELVKDTGPEVPRVRPDGSAVTQGRGTDNLWRSMKMLPTFDPVELAQTATTTEHYVSAVQAKDYVQMLHRAGYLARVKKGVSGRDGAQARYKLIRNTGPLPPMIQRVPQVWDQNLQKVTWSEASS